MRFGNPARDGQAESRATAVSLGARARLVSAEESLEDARPQFRWYPASGVRHTHHVFLAVALASYPDAPEVRRVLDRVVQEIQEHTAEQRLLRLDRGFRRSL